MSELIVLLTNPLLKPKERTEALAAAILNDPREAEHLMAFCKNAKDPHVATVIESMEYALQKNGNIASSTWMHFVEEKLAAKAPRIKWESAKVIAHLAAQFPEEADACVAALLQNAEHTGTVVRWSAATALAAIYASQKTKVSELHVLLENLMRIEEKNSIKKIYAKALKK